MKLQDVPKAVGVSRITIYNYRKKLGIVEETADEVSDEIVEQFKKLAASKIKPSPSNNKVYRVDDLQYVNGIWQVRCNELVPVEFDWTDNGIACADITLTDSKGNVTANQVTSKGSYFIIPEINVNSVSSAQKGSGGLNWIAVQFRNGGRVWLNKQNKQQLFKG